MDASESELRRSDLRMLDRISGSLCACCCRRSNTRKVRGECVPCGGPDDPIPPKCIEQASQEAFRLEPEHFVEREECGVGGARAGLVACGIVIVIGSTSRHRGSPAKCSGRPTVFFVRVGVKLVLLQ